jgi:hypothetical protein
MVFALGTDGHVWQVWPEEVPMKKVLIVLVLLVGALLVIVYTRPDTYKVERSTKIDAPPTVVFDQLEDLKAWSAWSPWDKRDPAMKKTFEGPPRGVGAAYAWEGNKEVGKGKMTITESQPPSQVKYKLEFIEPFAAVASSGFTVAPEGVGSKVTWSMDGNANFMTKAMSLVKPMDEAIGPDFEKGLAGLKAASETDAKNRAVAAAAAAEMAKAKAALEEKAKADEAAAAAAAAPKGKAKGKGKR